MRRSTVAHFACKVRGTNIAAAKHELKNNKIIPQSVDHVRYVFVDLTLRVSYNASPHPPPQKACNPSLQIRIGSLYQVIDLRPRVALPSAANRAAFGREQHYSWPQIDNVSVTRLTFNRASALCRPASPPLSSQKKAPTRIIFDPGGSVLSLYSPSHHDCLESEIVTYVLSSFAPWRVSFVV